MIMNMKFVEAMYVALRVEARVALSWLFCRIDRSLVGRAPLVAEEPPKRGRRDTLHAPEDTRRSPLPSLFFRSE